MIEPNASTVTHKLRIRATRETVWRYWTDPQRICEWWGVAAELQPEPGGSCIVDLGGGAVMRGEYVELEPFERLVFTFGWDPHPEGPDVPPGSSTVEVTLADDDGETILTLRHTDLPAGEVHRHDEGWAHFLPLLVTSADQTRRG